MTGSLGKSAASLAQLSGLDFSSLGSRTMSAQCCPDRRAAGRRKIMTQPHQTDTPAIQDVKQLGLAASIASLGYVFWIVGGMEMVERLAYYGVRSVSGLYVTAPVSEGGLGVTAQDLGLIFFIWALFQSLVPALVGGLSDRLGYKRTIFLSTVVKIVSYLIMASFPSFYGFMVGAIVLATGTGIFKPGIQGTLVKTTNRQNS